MHTSPFLFFLHQPRPDCRTMVAVACKSRWACAIGPRYEHDLQQPEGGPKAHKPTGSTSCYLTAGAEVADKDLARPGALSDTIHWYRARPIVLF